MASPTASHRHSGNYSKAPPKLPFTLPELTFLGLEHALPDKDAPVWEPTPEMFTLLLQSLGVLPIESTSASQQQQQRRQQRQQEPLVTIAVAQELNLSPMHGQHKSRLFEKSPRHIFESEQDPLSQQYILTTSDAEHKYLCKIFTNCDLFRHPTVKVQRERHLDAMKRHVQTAIENELGAIEWVRTECSSIKTSDILGYGYHLGCVPEMAEWLDRFGILGYILMSFPRSGVVYRGPCEGSPPLESAAKRYLCDQIAKLVHEMRRSSQEEIAGFAFPDMSSSRISGSSFRSRGQEEKVFKPFNIRSRFNLIVEAMQERASGLQKPYIQSSPSSYSTTVTNISSGDITTCAQKEKNRKTVPFHLSISSSDQSDQASTSSSSNRDPTVYCSSEPPVGGRICTLEGDGVNPSDRVPWPTQFVLPESIHNSVAEYEQTCLKNALVALGRLDGAVSPKCIFPEELLTLLPRILSLANNRTLFFDLGPEASKAGNESNFVASHENIFDSVRIVFTHNDLNASSLIVDPSTGDLLGLINLQYAGFFPEYIEPIRQLFVLDTPESASPTLAFLSTDPSEQEKDSDVEDDVLRKRKSFKGLVGSIIRRSSGSHKRQPSTYDTTRTVSKGNGKAIAKHTRIIVPFSRTGGHPFPFATVNRFTTNGLLSAAPKSMIFAKKTRRTRCESTHFTLEKAMSMSEPKKGSLRSVSWIKRRSTNCTTETEPASGPNSCSSSPVDSQAKEPSDLESNDVRQASHKVGRHVIVPKALHLCSNSWQQFLGFLREYEVKWIERQTRVRLSARILQDNCDSYCHYMQGLMLAGEDMTPEDVSNRPPSTVSTRSAIILSNPDIGSARRSRSSLAPETDVASSWATRDSDRIELGYGPVLEAFVSMTKTLQNLVVALEAGVRVFTPEQFLRMIEDKARKEKSTMLPRQNLTSHRATTDDAQQFNLAEEQKRQQQLYRMVAAASAAVSPSSSFEPVMPQPKPKRNRVKRLLKNMFNSKRSKQLHKPVVASYQPPIRTSEDNILYMGPPERDPLPSELPRHLVFVAPPPKTKPFSTTSFSSSSPRLKALQSNNTSTTHLSVDTSIDDGDTCSYNSDDTDEIRHQIALPPVVISGGPYYGLPPSMGAIVSDIPVYGVRLSACDGARTLYESERERLEEEEKRFWAEFEGEDREVVQQQQRGSRQNGRVVILDINDLEANVGIIEEFLAKGSRKE